MKVGIGYINATDSFAAGKAATALAVKNGQIEHPHFVMAFCSQQVDAKTCFRGIKSAVGDHVPVIGGSAIGVITNSDISYEGAPVAVAVFQTIRLKYDIACAANLDQDEMQTGRKLAESFSHPRDGKLLLIFYDSLKIPPTDKTPPIMNASPPLIQGIESVIAPDIPILGAGLLGDFEFSPPRQFCGSRIASQSGVGTMFSGNLCHYHQIMHGATPMNGAYHVITAMEGAFIYEVDGQPIVEMINDIYGNERWQSQNPVKRLSIGVNHGDKFGDYHEDQYVNRLIAGVLPDRKGIVLFEPDLETGTEFLFMLRDSNQMFESARQNTTALLARIEKDGKRPLFGCYIDCAGRTALFSETLTEEAAEVREIFNQRNIPLLGFYSGVEVAPLLGKSRGLDWTGVLWVIAEG